MAVPANGPNMKAEPWVANSRIFWINNPMFSKIAFPMGVFKTKTASETWSTNPIPIVFRLINFLLFDIENANKNINSIPKIPKNLSIYSPLLAIEIILAQCKKKRQLLSALLTLRIMGKFMNKHLLSEGFKRPFDVFVYNLFN